MVGRIGYVHWMYSCLGATAVRHQHLPGLQPAICMPRFLYIYAVYRIHYGMIPAQIIPMGPRGDMTRDSSWPGAALTSIPRFHQACGSCKSPEGLPPNTIVPVTQWLACRSYIVRALLSNMTRNAKVEGSTPSRNMLIFALLFYWKHGRPPACAGTPQRVWALPPKQGKNAADPGLLSQAVTP